MQDFDGIYLQEKKDSRKGFDYSEEDEMHIMGTVLKKPLLNKMSPNSVLANPGLYAFCVKIENTGWDRKSLAPNSSFEDYIKMMIINKPSSPTLRVGKLVDKGGPSFQFFRAKDLKALLDEYDIELKETIEDESYLYEESDYIYYAPYSGDNEYKIEAMFINDGKMFEGYNKLHFEWLTLDKNTDILERTPSQLRKAIVYDQLVEQPQFEPIGKGEDYENAMNEVDDMLRLDESMQFIGTCQEVGERGDMPWEDASQMACDLGYYADFDAKWSGTPEESNYEEISKAEFEGLVDHKLPKHKFVFIKRYDDSIYIAYDKDKDIHYIFA
jgi:hypothetical protein